MVAEVTKTLATFIGATEPYTAPMTDIGKLLSKVGIVKADFENLAALLPAADAPQAPTAPPPDSPVVVTLAPPPSVLAPPVPATAVLAPPSPPAVETEEQMPDAVDTRPPPGMAEIAQAYSLMYQAAGPDANKMAERLGCSRNTFVNWCTGKTPPKCTAANARFLAAYCVKAAADLNAAYEIFSRVR